MSRLPLEEDAAFGASERRNRVGRLVGDESVKLVRAEQFLVGALLSGMVYLAILAAGLS